MKPVEAAVEIAKSFGLEICEPQLLRSTNNVVAWLRPSSVVAKVGIRHQPEFCWEIRIASELHAIGAPVVEPASEIPSVVHSRNEFDITYWRYYPQPTVVDIAASKLASALWRLHEAYAHISAELKADLPSYSVELECVSHLLRESERLILLADADRELLLNAFNWLNERLQNLSRSHTHVTIHGSPHSYNILVVDNEPRFIDFETTCVGPLEWDLAHMDHDVSRAYTPVPNEELLETCRKMISVITAAWCWADADRGDLRHHAEVHLTKVKRWFQNDV